MSSTGTYAPSGASTAPATATPLIAAAILGLFVLAAVLSAARKDVTQGFDEVAHTSYVAQIQHTGEAWPAFNSLRLLDPQTFHFTDAANYLNHPPIFYGLLAAIGPDLENAFRRIFKQVFELFLRPDHFAGAGRDQFLQVNESGF